MGAKSSKQVAPGDKYGAADLEQSIVDAFGSNIWQKEKTDAVRKQVIGGIEQVNGADTDGTSLLDVQRGIFNLLQAGAYRAARHAYAADFHTHDRAQNYPYLLGDYVKFAGVCMEAYKAVKVLDPSHHAKIDQMLSELTSMETGVRKKMETWTDADEEAFVSKRAAYAEKKAAAEAEAKKNSPPAELVRQKTQAVREAQHGTLKVLLKNARDLKAADSNGFSDPYVIVSAGASKKTSKVIKKTLNPDWDQELELPGDLSTLLKSGLNLKFMDMDFGLWNDDTIGNVQVSLEPLRDANHHVFAGEKITSKGTCTFECTWIPDPPGAKVAISSDAEAFLEGFGEVKHAATPKIYLEAEQHVLLDANSDWEANEARRGAVVPVKFWYETYMPLLLEVCSLGVEGYAASDANDKALDAWLAQMTKERNFEKYGTDLVEGWAACSTATKLSLKRAWRLSRHYFLGPQKQRERSAESGADHRQTGDLTQYVAFLDVYVGRSYVEAAGMRLTFPYFVGPSTWVWHHFLGERAQQLMNKGDEAAADKVLSAFKSYVPMLLAQYPCPYCRHHFNEYVIRNVEKDMYPVEYILIGWKATDEAPRLTVPADKLAYITDTTKLRLFIWKLHNAVSSSIERGEAWYKQAKDSINTNRYWPNLYATVYRGTWGSGAISADRCAKTLSVYDAAVKLNAMRSLVINATPEAAAETFETLKPLVADLDKAILESNFLEEVYGFSGKIDDAPPDPDYAKKSEAFGRNINFTLA